MSATRHSLAPLLCVTITLAVSCSAEHREHLAKVEQELSSQTTNAATTGAGYTTASSGYATSTMSASSGSGSGAGASGGADSGAFAQGGVRCDLGGSGDPTVGSLAVIVALAAGARRRLRRAHMSPSS